MVAQRRMLNLAQLSMQIEADAMAALLATDLLIEEQPVQTNDTELPTNPDAIADGVDTSLC